MGPYFFCVKKTFEIRSLLSEIPTIQYRTFCNQLKFNSIFFGIPFVNSYANCMIMSTCHSIIGLANLNHHKFITRIHISGISLDATVFIIIAIIVLIIEYCQEESGYEFEI